MTLFRLPFAAFACALLVSTAYATVGEPLVVGEAWWLPQERAVVVQVLGGEFEERQRLELDAPRPRRFVRLDDVNEDTAPRVPLVHGDGAFQARVTRVRRGPRPDDANLMQPLDLYVQIRGPSGSREVRVRAYDRRVRIDRVLDIPGEPFSLVILEYLGLGFEGGYAVQEPILMRHNRRSL